MEQQGVVNKAVELAKSSDSTIIVLLVVIVLLIIALIPVIKTIAGIDKEKRAQDAQREGQLIQVIKDNTKVISSLKTLIENDQKFCVDCKNEQMGNFRKLFDNQEIANVELAKIHTILKGVEKSDKGKVCQTN